MTGMHFSRPRWFAIGCFVPWFAALAGCGEKPAPVPVATIVPVVTAPAQSSSLSEEVADLVPSSAEMPAPAPEEPAALPHVSIQATDSDWPRFRGPDGSGVSAETGLPLTWSSTENIAWKTELPGPGSSSPITFGEHIYVTCYSGYGESAESPGDAADLKRHLVCIDRQSGRILWDKTIASEITEQPYTDILTRHGYSSSTPAADAGGVYVFYGAAGAAAYSHAGELKWHRSLGTNVQNYGSGISPILDGDRLIVDASMESPGAPGSSGLHALDKQTGEVIWKQTGIGGGGYLTPTLTQSNGQRQLIVSQPWGRALVGASPETGEVLWRCNASAYTPTPVVDDEGTIYLVNKSGYCAIRTGGSGDVTESHKHWEVDSPIYRQASPLYWQGHLYFIPMDGGIACCVNAQTGETVYRERLRPDPGQIYASPVLVDGRIYYVSRFQGTYVLPARPEFELLAHNVIETDDSSFNGSPAVSDGNLLLRSDRYLYCLKGADRTTAVQPARIEVLHAVVPEPIEPDPIPHVAESVEFTPDQKGHDGFVTPFLRTHCLRCHGPEKQEADFRIDEHLPNDFLDRTVADRWSEVLNMLNGGDMPPEDAPQPSREEARPIVEWIERERLRAERARRDTNIVLRRLNREEYNNTIRDLTGVKLDLVEEFPADPTAGGFDNNGGALSVSPLHLELYLKAARKVFDRAIVDDDAGPGAIKWHFEIEDGLPSSDRRHVRLDDDLNRSVHLDCGPRPPRDGFIVLRAPGEACRVQYFQPPRAGEYIIRIRAAGATPAEDFVRAEGPIVDLRHRQNDWQKLDSADRQSRQEQYDRWSAPSIKRHYAEDRTYRYGPPRMRIVGYFGSQRPVLDAYDVTAQVEDPAVHESRVLFTTEKTSIEVTNPYRIPYAPHWNPHYIVQRDDFPRPELLIDWIEIEGPLYDSWPPSSHPRILFASPNRNQDEVAYAREVLARFMPRAYRRRLRAGELDSKVALFEQVRPQKSSFAAAIKVPLQSVLVSPHFLYLVEDADSKNSTRTLDDFELAARLSYFLWSSMPDDELFRLAAAGQLQNAATLRTQVNRMLADPKSEAFVRNFAGQWLELRKVGLNPPDVPRYDEHLEVSMRGETEAFFAHVLRHDRSVLEFLNCDYVTVNQRLARFYDIDDVQGDHFRPVPVPAECHRGGLVTQAAILAITSNGTRTSPVWRGEWVLKNLLGDPPPPPPPNAGDIPPVEQGEQEITLRERLQLHRHESQCARCHNKIDPLGFALENFDHSGQWRDKDGTRGNSPAIDSRVRMPDGAEFEGVDGLRDELLNRQDAFLACLAEKMFTYALGRELGYADHTQVNEAVAAMQDGDLTLRSLIRAVVASRVFRSK